MQPYFLIFDNFKFSLSAARSISSCDFWICDPSVTIDRENLSVGFPKINLGADRLAGPESTTRLSPAAYSTRATVLWLMTVLESRMR